MANTVNAIITTSTIEQLETQINKFFYSTGYYIKDLTLYHPTINCGKFKIKKTKNRYKFYIIKN